MPDQTPPPPPVTMRDPATGVAHDIPADQVETYRALGFSPETMEQRGGRLASDVREVTYGGAAGQIGAGITAAVRGATLGGSDALARALGGEDTAYDLRGLRDVNPVTSTVGELAGAVVPTLVSGGASLPSSLAGRAGRAVASLGESSGAVGRLGATALGGATEGSIYGLGGGVSELALSDDPLTVEHAASVLSSNMLYGAGLGAAAGTLAHGVERGLSRAQSAIAEHQAARASLEAVTPELGAMDAAGLRAAHDAELSQLAQTQVEQRAAQKTAAVDDLTSYRQEVKDANPWLVINEGEASKQLTKANSAIRSALDTPKALRDSPGRVLGPLEVEEQALQHAVDNRAAIAAKLDEQNAKIAADLEKGLAGPAPAVPAKSSVPEYDAIKAHEARTDSALEQTVPAREIAARGYFEPPGASVDQVRVQKARDIFAPGGAGQREAIDLNVTPSGKITVTGGRHRLAAAIEADAPIKVRWSAGAEPAADDVLRGAASAPSAATWKEFQASKMAEYMRSEGGHAGAMKRLSSEWEAIKARPAAAPPVPAPESIELTGKAARRYASYADVKIPRGGSVTVERAKAQEFLDALKGGDIQGESRSALDKIGGLLERNRALQSKIREATTPLLPKSELTSEHLSAIKAARDALATPEKKSLLQNMLGGSLFGGISSAVGAIPLVGQVPGLAHMIGAKGAELANRVMFGKLGAAIGAQSGKSAEAAATFLGKAQSVASAAGRAAPMVATKVLQALRYGTHADDAAAGDTSGKSLASLYKARTDEIKEQVHIAADGSFQMRPAARQAMASKLAAIGAVNPVLADRLESAGARRITYLAAMIPRRPDLVGMQVGPDTWQPSDMEMRSWARRAYAADHPMEVLDRVVDGSVTPEDAETMRAVHPEILREFVNSVTAELPTLRKSLSYDRQLALSIFSGVPVTPALDPKVIGYLQSQFQSEPGSAGGTQAPKPTPQFGALQKSVDTPTPAQTRSQGAHA